MGAIRLRTDVLSGVGGQTQLSSCNDDMALAIGIVGIAWRDRFDWAAGRQPFGD